MNKYQQFAVNHYVSCTNSGMSFEDVLTVCAGLDSYAIKKNEAYEHLTFEEIADDIYQMAADLETCLK